MKGKKRWAGGGGRHPYNERKKDFTIQDFKDSILTSFSIFYPSFKHASNQVFKYPEKNEFQALSMLFVLEISSTRKIQAWDVAFYYVSFYNLD